MKFALVLLAVGAVLAAPHTKIESRLAASLATRGSANVLVSFKGSNDAAIASLETRTYSTRTERLQTVADTLRAHAARSQKSALEVLTRLGVAHDVLWISNQIYIQEITEKVVNELAAIENVSEIAEEFEVTIDPIIVGEPAAPGILAEWGIEKINAPAAWALPGGNNGAGIIVASIDTGGHASHTDLAANFVGNNYGWRDFTAGPSQTARDNNGHGTHTIGTMVGQGGIGVAPGAKWMACKALNAQGSGTNAGLISCGQFIACPTLPNGNSPDCSKAPHVVNNSWGGGQGNTFYNAVINSWKAAGIIPVFANGNSGPACSTANSPADSTAGVIGVGATTSANGMADFSSKGPTTGGRPSPLISAPGASIRSTWHTSNTAYNTISGTSMAAPHVAGVTALLLSRNRNLTYAQVSNALTSTTMKNVNPTGRNCGGVNESNYPNNAAGAGVVNAQGALQNVISGRF